MALAYRVSPRQRPWQTAGCFGHMAGSGSVAPGPTVRTDGPGPGPLDDHGSTLLW